MFSDWKHSASGGRLPELNGKIPSFANMRQGMDPGYTDVRRHPFEHVFHWPADRTGWNSRSLHCARFASLRSGWQYWIQRN